jgi:hypothetical protein
MVQAFKVYMLIATDNLYYMLLIIMSILILNIIAHQLRTTYTRLISQA